MPNRTELTDKLQRVRGMVEYVRENLDGDEYEAFLDMVAPLPEAEVAVRKPQKKSTKKSGGKSRRAQELSDNVRQNLQRREPIVGGFADDTDMVRCTVIRGDLGGTICGLLPDHNVHHMQSARGFHPFVSASDVQPAPASSSANGGVESTTANSAVEMASAGAVTGGSNE